MDSDIHFLVGAEIRSVVEAIHFEQIAAGDVGSGGEWIVLFDDIHSMRTHIQMVADLVSALIGTVQREIDKLVSRIEFESEPLSHFVGDGIANHCLVACIGKKCPVPGFCISLPQELLFLMKFDAIGFLCHVPSGIASTTNLQRIELQNIVLLIHIVHGCIHIIRLAPNTHITEGVDKHMRQIGPPRKVLSEQRERKNKSQCEKQKAKSKRRYVEQSFHQK